MSKILVIDDHASNRALLVALLSDKGHQILEAEGGEQGLALALAERPELVITDIVMPTMDGFEFVERLRAALGESTPPIIFNSVSYLEQETRALAKACGVRFVLTKPCKLETILQTVDAALRAGGGAPAQLGRETEGLPSRLLAEKKLNGTDQLQATTERMRALLDIALILMAERDPAQLLEKCCSAARKIVGSKYANAGLLGEDGKTVRYFAVSGMDPEESARCGASLICGGPIHIVLAEHRLVSLRTPVSNPVALGFYPEHPPIHSYLAVRIQTSAGICGWLSFANKLGRDEFDEEEERIALSLASQLAVTYENARLYEQINRHAAKLQLEITERHRVQEALVKLRKAVDTSGEVIFMTDREGVFTFVNPEFTRLYGYTEQEVVVRKATPRVLKSGQSSHEDDAIFWKTILNKLVVKKELVNKSKDGRLVNIESSVSPILDEQGDIAGFLAIQRDITERRQLELQLAQSQKMEAVGRLAGGVAHDFNNLLTVISGYAELLLDGTSSGNPTRTSLEEIRKAGERAAALTRQLLAFSRQQVLAPQVLDLNAAIAEMDKMLRRLIGEDIDLVILPGANVGRIKADPGQIEQVIMNMAVNARDAMPEGGKLTIEAANVDLDGSYAQRDTEAAPGRYVMLAVTDNGSGMDQETQARIFEPFFTTKAQGKGTGLGLATVYGIVKQSGGFIWVYSELGQGTTFKIYLPRVEEIAAAVEPVRARPAPHRGSETILVVEDEEALRSLIRTVLEANGYTVLAASGGIEALGICKIQSCAIHLVLTDVVMPQMTGRELVKRMASLRPETKVLYMSGYTDNAMVHHGVLDGGTPFLQKPFTPDALARKVREVLAA
jgi:PAS domain S-box-containing protein